jgi:dTDP-glucose 4,6-dehydratase
MIMETLLVTGGCGFIGSNYILHFQGDSCRRIINLDKLTYAGNPANLASLSGDSRYIFRQGDVCDRTLIRKLMLQYSPDAIIHFAAESHVDRSIIDPDTFIQTNIVGTFTLLDEARSYWEKLDPVKKSRFRFHHISTDEVYGSLRSEDPPFHEKTPYAPNSPYSASKAASDHLAYSFFKTYGLPVLITNCSNNYGPYQFPEKMIPLMIINALEGKELPIYGDGMNIRDWLFVSDHVAALKAVLANGIPGEKYNIGGSCEKANREVVDTICSILDEVHPQAVHYPHRSLIRFVKDRPGHDRRYAIDSNKITCEIGWAPKTSFDEGLRRTIRWYIDNWDWVQSVKTGNYRDWIDTNYRKR